MNSSYFKGRVLSKDDTINTMLFYMYIYEMSLLLFVIYKNY